MCDAPAFSRTLYASGEPPQGSDCAPRQANSAQSPRQLQLSPHERFGQGATALAAAHSSIFALALTTQPRPAHALHGRPREPPQGSSCTPRQADSASSSSQLHSALTSAPDRALRQSALRRRAARLSCGFSDHTRHRDALRLKNSSSALDLSAVARTTCSSEPEKAAYWSVSGGCALLSPRPLWSPPNCGAGPRQVTVADMNTVVGLVMIVWARKKRTTH